MTLVPHSAIGADWEGPVRPAGVHSLWAESVGENCRKRVSDEKRGWGAPALTLFQKAWAAGVCWRVRERRGVSGGAGGSEGAA